MIKMNKTQICKALYALSGGGVIPRRKPLYTAVLLAAAGAAMIVANNVWAEALTNNLSSAFVFVGGALLLAGMILLLVRLFGSEGDPYHRAQRRFLSYDELSFRHEDGSRVVRCIDEGDLEGLLALPRADVPAVTVALYRTPDNRFAAMQAFAYAELEYRPLTELKIRGE